jgi:CBS domain containing-hemolysin-like protein
MTPLLLFLLGALAAYVSTVTTAFSALMRLSLRLQAERGGRHDTLGWYLHEPLRLFIPARLLLAGLTIAAVTLLARVTGLDFSRGFPLLVVASLLFVLVCEHLIPLVIIRRNPERVLEILLPSFDVIARLLKPLSGSLRRLVRRPQPPVPAVETIDEQRSGEPADRENHPSGDQRHELQEGQARELLRSLVEFRETMVREVMTPRPDIVAIESNSTIGDLVTVAREQQYSRIPVYHDSLDNIVGMISIKDLILLDRADVSKPIAPLIRAAHFVPETKLVPELLTEFQRKRIQAALVVDEYGGTAGLVTVEDLLEEIVGEIRDEYDTELEPIVEEAEGVYVFSGRTHVRELQERLKADVEGGGYETVGGYLLAHAGRVPAVGETFEIDGLLVEVLEAERRRINRVRIRRVVSEPAPAEQAG